MLPFFKRITRGIRYRLLSEKEKRHFLVGPAKLWKMKQDFQFNFVTEQGLVPNKFFLDIGCGTLRGGIPIIRLLDSGHYTGLEVREEVLAEAWRELEEERLVEKSPILVHSADMTTLKLDQRFDMALAFSVLIHMEDSTVDQTLAMVSRYLKPDGVFFANVNLEDREDAAWQGFRVAFRPGSFYEQLAVNHGLTTDVLGTLESLGHRSGQPRADQQIMLAFRKVAD